jgi:uncharacterized membrane protein (UPF0127 family)
MIATRPCFHVGVRFALALALVATVVAPACRTAPRTPMPAGSSATTAVIETGAGAVTFRVEVADTEAEREVGLMGRTSLDADAGMVFLFDGTTTASFWMKDTLIPLSIAFWGTDGRIVGILDMEPCEADPCPTFNPGVPYVGALEANLGSFSDRGVAVGDTVRLEGAP